MSDASKRKLSTDASLNVALLSYDSLDLLEHLLRPENGHYDGYVTTCQQLYEITGYLPDTIPALMDKLRYVKTHPDEHNLEDFIEQLAIQSPRSNRQAKEIFTFLADNLEHIEVAFTDFGKQHSQVIREELDRARGIVKPSTPLLPSDLKFLTEDLDKHLPDDFLGVTLNLGSNDYSRLRMVNVIYAAADKLGLVQPTKEVATVEESMTRQLLSLMRTPEALDNIFTYLNKIPRRYVQDAPIGLGDVFKHYYEEKLSELKTQYSERPEHSYLPILAMQQVLTVAHFAAPSEPELAKTASNGLAKETMAAAKEQERQFFTAKARRESMLKGAGRIQSYNELFAEQDPLRYMRIFVSAMLKGRLSFEELMDISQRCHDGNATHEITGPDAHGGNWNIALNFEEQKVIISGDVIDYKHHPYENPASTNNPAPKNFKFDDVVPRGVLPKTEKWKGMYLAPLEVLSRNIVCDAITAAGGAEKFRKIVVDYFNEKEAKAFPELTHSGAPSPGEQRVYQFELAFANYHERVEGIETSYTRADQIIAMDRSHLGEMSLFALHSPDYEIDTFGIDADQAYIAGKGEIPLTSANAKVKQKQSWQDLVKPYSSITLRDEGLAHKVGYAETSHQVSQDMKKGNKPNNWDGRTLLCYAMESMAEEFPFVSRLRAIKQGKGDYEIYRATDKPLPSSGIDQHGEKIKLKIPRGAKEKRSWLQNCGRRPELGEEQKLFTQRMEQASEPRER